MIGLGTAATQLDTSVNIAFPAITQGFGLSIADIQWVVISYVLTYASLLLALGRIGDTVGHIRVFRIGLIWSTVALLLVGWSPGFGAMLVFRCPAGHRCSAGAELRRSAGDLAPWRGAAQSGARHLHHDARDRLDARSAAWRRADVGLGLAGGVLVPGPDRASRRCCCCAACRHRRSGRQAIASISREVSALVLGLVTMLFALNRLRELSAIWFALLSALAFAAFIFRESRAARPIIAVGILRQPAFALLNLVSVLVNLAAFSVWLLVPYVLARVPGYSLTESGAILATAAAGAALSAPIGGRLVGSRMSARRLAIAGAAASGIGLLLIGAWTEQTPTWLRIAALVVQGVGLGLFQLAYSDIVTAALPLRDRGVAGSLVLLTRTLGTVTSASVVLMVFDILNVKDGFLEAFQTTFQLAALLAFAAAGSLALSPRRIGHP